MSAAPETDAVNGIYAAINRNDIPAMLKFFAPEIERIEPEGFPTAGTYRGHTELSAHVAHGRGTWAEGTCTPEDIIVAGDKVVALLYVHVRLKAKQDWVDARFADGFIFRNGKAVQWRSFAERKDALAWAGIVASNAT
ncbi:MAG: nuclear transport factor 2 family protein [Rhodospirillaceae bacterium]|nr:nuclear transport factor 2 family protein [Rhodospirillaceae bacterium]